MVLQPKGPQVEFVEFIVTLKGWGGETRGNWSELIVTLGQGTFFWAQDNFLFYLFSIRCSSITVKRLERERQFHTAQSRGKYGL
jgi:hypothetical protein